MNLDEHMSNALCNCFGQAEAFLNTFLDSGRVVKNLRVKRAAIKVTLWTDLGSKVAGHSMVCVLESGVIRICQAFYDSKSRFKHTHTLTKSQTRTLMASLQTPKKTVRVLKHLVPEVKSMFEPTDKIEVDVECVRF